MQLIVETSSEYLRNRLIYSHLYIPGNKHQGEKFSFIYHTLEDQQTKESLLMRSPNLWDLIVKIWCGADIITIETKCTIDEKHLNHPQTISILPSPWKNCLAWNCSLVPKGVGDCCSTVQATGSGKGLQHELQELSSALLLTNWMNLICKMKKAEPAWEDCSEG